MAEKAKMVHDQETRDLMRLLHERQSAAINSVVQLARDPAQAFALHQTAATVAIGGAAGAYGAWQGKTIEDPIAFAETILSLMREAKHG